MRNYQNQHENKRKEHSEKTIADKKELQKAFRERVSTTKKIEVTQDDSKYKHLYKTSKKNNDTLEKQINKLQVKLAKTQMELRNAHQSVGHAKDLAIELKNNQSKSSEKLKNKDIEINLLSLELVTLKTEFKNDKELLTSQSKIIEHYQKELQKARKIIKKYNEFKKDKSDLLDNIKDLESDIKKESEQKNQFRSQMIEARNELISHRGLDIATTLEKLHEELNVKNVLEYGLLASLVRKERVLRKTISYSRLNNGKSIKQVIYGHVAKIDGAYTFIDLEKVQYSVGAYPNMKHLNKKAASAFLKDDGSVDVFWIFTNLTEMLDSRHEVTQQWQSAKKQITYKPDKLDFEKLADFKVIIVTSLNGDKYKKRLLKHGVQANWIDPFEKSPVHVKNEIATADIALLCVKNMPHSILHTIEEMDNEKIQFLINHNEETVYKKTRFAASQLGLI